MTSSVVRARRSSSQYAGITIESLREELRVACGVLVKLFLIYAVSRYREGATGIQTDGT
jgi:hypothetical protein